MFQNVKVEAGPTRSAAERGRKRRDVSIDDLLHSGVDTDQVILLQAELVRSSLRPDSSLAECLGRIEENAIRNAWMLNDIRRRLRLDVPRLGL